jgi:hypothetical protein
VDTKVAGVSFELFPSLEITGQYQNPGCHYNWGGSIGISGNMAVSRSWPFIFMAGPAPVPMFAKASVNLSGNLNAGVEDINPVKLNGNLVFNPGVRGSLEAGFDGFLSAGGWLGGGSTYSFHWPVAPHLKDIAIDLQGGLTVTALVWKYENELLHWGWSLNGGSAAAASRSALSFQAGPKAIPRDYLTAPNAGKLRRIPAYSIRTFANDEAQAYSVAVSPVVTSVFPISGSSLSSAGSSVNLLYVTDNPNRTANNRTMLVHSIFDGTNWSMPQPVSDDGAADFHPVALTFSDGGMMAAWENEKTTLADTATLDDAVAGLEISAAAYNPVTKTWGTATHLTSDSYLHRTPKLAGKSKNNLLLTWLGNETNDLSGSSANPNKLWYAFYNGSAWSAPQGAPSFPTPSSATASPTTAAPPMWHWRSTAATILPSWTTWNSTV